MSGSLLRVGKAYGSPRIRRSAPACTQASDNPSRLVAYSGNRAGFGIVSSSVGSRRGGPQARPSSPASRLSLQVRRMQRHAGRQVLSEGALRHAHTPAERHDATTSRAKPISATPTCSPRSTARGSQRHERLQQLQLSHSGDAADRQAFVPHEEAQEHAEGSDTYRKPAHAEALAPQLMGGDSSTSTSMTGAENTSAQEITSQPPMRRAISPPSA